MKSMLRIIHKLCKRIIDLAIMITIFMFAIFIITFFGFNKLLSLLDKFTNKLL